uniref:Uncharacterized protein n=1 Tax=Arundo donax TaxID=35708 RepID=A0A0A9H3V0_ARUDO
MQMQIKQLTCAGAPPPSLSFSLASPWRVLSHVLPICCPLPQILLLCRQNCGVLALLVLDVLVQSSLYLPSLNLEIIHLLRKVVDVVSNLVESPFS